MKLTTRIFGIGIIAIAIFFSCKKLDSHKTIQSKSNVDEEMMDYKLIEQKVYNLSPEETQKVINRFRAGKLNSTNNIETRLVEDDVSIDSSIFVLEAALNFDFDLPNVSNSKEASFSSEFTQPISLNNGKVMADDLESVYGELTNVLIQNTTSQVKAKVVDLVAYSVAGNQVVYKIHVVTFNQSLIGPCNTITVTGSPYKAAFSSGSYVSQLATLPGFNCPGNPINDATALMNADILCSFQPADYCAVGTYYTNVLSVNTNGNSKYTWNGINYSPNTAPNHLFSSDPLYPNQHCGMPYKVLTALQINNYLAAGKNELTANIPVTPMGMILASGGYKPLSSALNNGGNNNLYKVYWNLQAVYGVKHCRIIAKTPPFNADPQ